MKPFLTAGSILEHNTEVILNYVESIAQKLYENVLLFALNEYW